MVVSGIVPFKSIQREIENVTDGDGPSDFPGHPSPTVFTRTWRDLAHLTKPRGLWINVTQPAAPHPRGVIASEPQEFPAANPNPFISQWLHRF